MPTENRSSNTDQMVSVPRDEVERLVKLLKYQAHPYPSPHAEFWQGLLDAPAQHKGDPDRALKDALFACLAAGGDDREYGGVATAGDRQGWVRFTTVASGAQHQGELERLRAALKFYADREHYHFESGNWDTVSGEPLNILWCGDDPDFIEDGSVARAALSTSAVPSNDLCAEGAHEFVPFRSKCVKCGEPYSAEPSAREAQALKDESRLGIERLPAEPSAPDGLEGVEDLARRIAARVKARAALERMP